MRLRLELRGNDGNAAGFVIPAELAADAGARETWATWSFTRHKEAARLLTEAKQPETRGRRLTKVLADLRD
jgi:hypothetical protein